MDATYFNPHTGPHICTQMLEPPYGNPILESRYSMVIANPRLKSPVLERHNRTHFLNLILRYSYWKPPLVTPYWNPLIRSHSTIWILEPPYRNTILHPTFWSAHNGINNMLCLLYLSTTGMHSASDARTCINNGKAHLVHTGPCWPSRFSVPLKNAPNSICMVAHAAAQGNSTHDRHSTRGSSPVTWFND